MLQGLAMAVAAAGMLTVVVFIDMAYSALLPLPRSYGARWFYLSAQTEFVTDRTEAVRWFAREIEIRILQFQYHGAWLYHAPTMALETKVSGSLRGAFQRMFRPV